jgi:2-oxoisovalerate dehydrogenase E2 component (dihydrolipoyl transacylase)
MGKFTFNLPDIGEGIAEAEIVTWHVKVGDRIEEDGKIADVMTDKATVEMESPVSGVVVSVAGEEGDMVAIGSALVVIEVEGDVEEGPGASTSLAECGLFARANQAQVPFVSSEVETPTAKPAPPAKTEAAPQSVSDLSPDTNGGGGQSVGLSSGPSTRQRPRD